MPKMRTDANRLAAQIDDTAQSFANGQRIMLKRRRGVPYNIANAAARLALLVAEENGRLKSVTMVSDGGQPGGVAELNFQIRRHDGVGGAVVNLSDLKTGAVAADQKVTFAGIADEDIFSSGDVVECNVTVVGGGATPGQTLFELEYEYND